MRLQDIAMHPIEQRLVLAGCFFDFRHRAWRCPACRRPATLRLLRQPDASDRIDCTSGCAAGDVLQAVGATFFDVAPACFRPGGAP